MGKTMRRKIRSRSHVLKRKTRVKRRRSRIKKKRSRNKKRNTRNKRRNYINKRTRRKKRRTVPQRGGFGIGKVLAFVPVLLAAISRASASPPQFDNVVGVIQKNQLVCPPGGVQMDPATSVHPQMDGKRMARQMALNIHPDKVHYNTPEEEAEATKHFQNVLRIGNVLRKKQKTMDACAPLENLIGPSNLNQLQDAVKFIEEHRESRPNAGQYADNKAKKDDWRAALVTTGVAAGIVAAKQYGEDKRADAIQKLARERDRT